MGRSIKLTQDQIESWVARHFDYKRRRNGEELLICNPFDGDTSYKFNISTQLKKSKKSGAWGYWVHDWRPSASANNGSFLKFVQRYKGLTFWEALRDICGEGADIRALLPNNIEPISREPEIEVSLALPENAIPIQEPKWPKLQKMALGYLSSRCITPKEAEGFKVHYTPTMLIFPYLEYDSIVYWQGRTFSHVDKRFEFPGKSNKTDFIYGFDNAEPGQPVTIVEAIFCALTTGPGGLATGGATMAETQRRKLRAINPSCVTLAPDNDQEGKASIYKNFILLRDYYQTNYVIPPAPFKDWNQMAASYTNKNEGIEIVRNYQIDNCKPLTLKEALRFKKETSKNQHDYLMGSQLKRLT